MIMDEKRKEVAQTILQRGWIEATPENIKAYLDGFAMANQKDDAEVHITGEEYLSEILGVKIAYSDIMSFVGKNPHASPYTNIIPKGDDEKSDG